jgi:hypothetical protein
MSGPSPPSYRKHAAGTRAPRCTRASTSAHARAKRHRHDKAKLDVAFAAEIRPGCFAPNVSHSLKSTPKEFFVQGTFLIFSRVRRPFTPGRARNFRGGK